MQRHALTFPVRPGAEEQARRVLAGYPRPDTRVGEGARLLATSVFFWNEHVVRVIDVDGPFPVIMRHLAADPAIRATEEALNPLLAEPRRLDDPAQMKAFFDRALMRRVMHRVTVSDLLPRNGPYGRVALRYPVRAGHGETLERLLAEGRFPPVIVPERAVLASTTVFRHGDLVVQMADVAGDVTAGGRLVRTMLGASVVAAVNAVLEPGWDLSTSSGLERLFREQSLALVTHRRADAPSPRTEGRPERYRAVRKSGPWRPAPRRRPGE